MHTITNKNGMSVTLCSYGAIIQSILAPDRNGVPGEVVLGRDREEDYLEDNRLPRRDRGEIRQPYLRASFMLGGTRYELPQNQAMCVCTAGRAFIKDTGIWQQRKAEWF
jgi:aldose 1-epimerase